MKSIKRNLAIGLLLGFGLLLGGGSLLIYHLTGNALVGRFDAKLRVEALTIITYTKQKRDYVDVDFSDRYIREFDDEVATEFFQLWYPNGKSIERSDSLGGKDLPQRFGTMDEPEYWDLTVPNGHPARAIGLRFVPRADRDERKYQQADHEVGLVVAGDRRDLDQTLAALRTALLAVDLAGFAGTMLVVAVTLGKGLAPLRRVADQAGQISASTLQTRFPTAGMPAELLPISHRLNDLLARLQESFERERCFSADVAHELRTPIAELRSLAEVALKWSGSDQAATAAFKDALAIARQMESLVASLLAMVRCEAGKHAIASERIVLPELVEELWKPFATAAAQKHLEVTFHIPPDSGIESDRAMLSSILTNLFDNAVRYTPRRGSVRIAYWEEATGFSFAVVNTTDDLAAEDIPKLFQRFWRKDAARSSPEHSGLGLSLAQAFARTLGMTLRAELVQKATLAMTLEGRSAEGKPPA